LIADYGGSASFAEYHMNEGKLMWQCRRGMRELDELLTNYLQSSYGQAPKSEKDAFRQLLALSNPDLIDYLLENQEHDDSQIAGAIEKIRSLAQI
jgi:antitoxin CptB